jgi:hypothetical protein
MPQGEPEGAESAREPQPPCRSHVTDGTRRILTVAGVSLATPGASTGLAIGLHHAYGLGAAACVTVAFLPSALGLLSAVVVKIVRLIPDVKREQTIADITHAATREDHPLPIESAERLISVLASGREVARPGVCHRRTADAPGVTPPV